MNRRIVSAIAAAAGLIVIALAVCSATVWRPSSTAEATLPAAPDQPYVLVEPGVLGLVNSDVTVTASSQGQDVTLAVGYSADARAWLADDPYLSVTGLKDWKTLDTTSVTERCEAGPTASGAATKTASETPSTEPNDAAAAEGCTPLTASGADPAGADVWQTSVTETDTATTELDATDTDLVVLASTDDSDAAPTLTLTWSRSVSTPWLVPGLVLGGLLILLGVFGLLLDIQMRHADQQRRQRAAERAARLATADSTATMGIPAVNDPNRPLTRREARDKERAEAAGEEWIDPRTGVVYVDGVAAPSVPQAPEQEPEPTADDAPGSGQDAAGEAGEPAQVDGPTEPATDEDTLEAAGAARGSAVVPSLDEETVRSLRASRELETEEAFSLTDEDPAAEDEHAAPAASRDAVGEDTAVIDPVDPTAEGEENA
ncbi:hypothetical protein [Actinomyces faecalis]|uniref:hypothetical protein n=1 Tax=Actinomyces faecalis TaxID=2722820 RepID=UPI001FD01739|nr:hypothetical protein [Actinomyces faecalis]